ncbi:hypothetical protein NDU88_009039 [Pleurodeles waltl]|uniref:Uncharacterized protein n=1 Tax=Pleurodeles waltl TaxID=8319 RepID=A0AAV7PTY9_PLEWA|nr:hypothetical protein NDU88_009039 [Pleurodeles waltl]
MGDLSVAPAQTEVNVLNVETVPPSPSLHLIYQTITSQHKQTQRDSKKARVATKQLQVAVSKVAKTCSEIGERIAAIECRADALESDLGVVTKQAAMHESQLSDIQWKVEDFENRQRHQDIIKAQIRTQECYELSERVGKVLAYKTRQKTARSAILAIKDRLGQIVYGDTLVLQVFKEYYSALYQQENLFSDERDERMAQYLSDMSSPKLPQEEGYSSFEKLVEECQNHRRNPGGLQMMSASNACCLMCPCALERGEGARKLVPPGCVRPSRGAPGYKRAPPAQGVK